MKQGWSTEAKEKPARGQKKKRQALEKQGPVPMKTTKTLNFPTELNQVSAEMKRFSVLDVG